MKRQQRGFEAQAFGPCFEPMKRISAIIPAHNEEVYIQDAISCVRSLTEVDQVIVVDDGSGDRTVAFARRAGAEVLSTGACRGKSHALFIGARQVRHEIVLLMDADVLLSARSLRDLARPVLEEEAHMTVGVFPPGRYKGGFGLVLGLARGGIYLRCGQKLAAPLSGQRVLYREVLDRALPLAPGYGAEVDLTLKALKWGYRVEEVAIEGVHRRVTGRDWKGFYHRGRQFCHVWRALLMA